MRSATTIDELVADPLGCYLVGESWISFVADGDVAGMVVWGKPSAEDIRALERTHSRLREVLPKHGAFVDVRGLEAVDPAAFGVIGEFIASRGDWLAGGVSRLALVRADGVVGAITAGFFNMRVTPFEVEVFAEPDAALRWLSHGDPVALCDELDALVVEVTGTPALLRALRAHLDAHPGVLSLNDAANSVALSERSLQRKLAASNTTFQAELNQSQVRVAKRMLVETELALTRIALDVGCASLAHFSALFRKLTDTTPSEYRAQHRAKK